MRQFILPLLLAATSGPLSVLAAQQQNPLTHENAGQPATAEATGPSATNPLTHEGVGPAPKGQSTDSLKGNPLTHQRAAKHARAKTKPRPKRQSTDSVKGDPLTHKP